MQYNEGEITNPDYNYLMVYTKNNMRQLYYNRKNMTVSAQYMPKYEKTKIIKIVWKSGREKFYQDGKVIVEMKTDAGLLDYSLV